MNQAELAAALAERRPQHGRTEGPLVSIVIVTRNGAHHLSRLFPGLRENTSYRPIEVIVVDNGSTDDTEEVLRAEWGFDVTVIRNATNSTFSRANNQGIAAARGEFVLLLNNDIEPISRSWLGCLIDPLIEQSDLIATGPLLIYPERQFERGVTPAHPDLSVQHSGMYFDWRNGQLRAGNLGMGTDPLRPDATAVRRRPGVTAACLLTRKSALEAIEGFSDGYIYGSEDWDLCMKLQGLGDIAFVGAAALFHHEYGTQREITQSITEVNRRDNRQRFTERWGPRLARDLRMAIVQKRGFWNPDRPPKLLLAIGAKQQQYGMPERLAAALGERGWSTQVREVVNETTAEILSDVDVLITTTPDINLASTSPHTFKVALVVDQVDTWADPELLDEFRLVAVTNPLDGDLFESLTGMESLVLLPAGPQRPEPAPIDPVYEADILVEGNANDSRPQLPKLISVGPGERMVVSGTGWEQEPRFVRYWTGPIDADQHHSLASNSKFVVHSQRPNRTWLKSSGVLNTLAAGALPITDTFELSQWMFEGRLPVATSPKEFRSLIHRYRSDETARLDLIRELQGVARQAHTYRARAAQLDEAIEEALARPIVSIKISPHNREVARKWGDTHFARQFGRALRRQGFYTFSDILPQWDLPARQEADIVVHLRGLDPYVPKPGSFNVLWIVSHPADITPEECSRFDLVLVASHSFAEKLRHRVSVPVFPLLQATDPMVFYPPDTDGDLRNPVLYVGNARWPARIAPRWAMELGVPLTIYGANWDNFPERRLVAAPYFPNERLGALYGSADIVLNDHWPDMKQEGFIANRLFDVLAAGGFVLSDHVEGIEEVFDGAVPTYRTKEELGELLAHYRDHPEERAERAIHGMRKVREEHSFDARVRQFLDHVASVTDALPLDVSGSRVTRLDRRPVGLGLADEN